MADDTSASEYGYRTVSRALRSDHVDTLHWHEGFIFGRHLEVAMPNSNSNVILAREPRNQKMFHLFPKDGGFAEEDPDSARREVQIAVHREIEQFYDSVKGSQERGLDAEKVADLLRRIYQLPLNRSATKGQGRGRG